MFIDEESMKGLKGVKREIETVKAALLNLWERYWWWLVIFFITILCDSLSTIVFMLREGAEAEAHPAIRFVSEIFGPILGPLVGFAAKVLAGILVGVYCRKFAVYVFIAVSIISFWAAWYNLCGSQFYTPYILKWIVW